MHLLSVAKVKVLIINLLVSQELLHWTQVTRNNFNLLSMLKLKVVILQFLISQELLHWTQVTRENFGVLTFIMPYGSPNKPRIDCMVILITSFGIEKRSSYKYIKYGFWESTSSMDVLQQIILMIDHIMVISWYMQLLLDLFSTGNHINILLSTEPIVFGWMNITLISPYKTSTLQVLYNNNNILKCIFIIHTSSIWKKTQKMIMQKWDLTYLSRCLLFFMAIQKVSSV